MRVTAEVWDVIVFTVSLFSFNSHVQHTATSPQVITRSSELRRRLSAKNIQSESSRDDDAEDEGTSFVR